MAIAVPAITPIAVTLAISRSTMRITVAGSAPRAMRMPISLRRLVIASHITPYRPTTGDE